jgi:hypothetical protein
MAIKESTHFLINIFEDITELGFFVVVAMRMVEAVPIMGYLYIHSLPQKLLKFMLGFLG